MLKKRNNHQLVTAKEAFESTKAPQLENVIREIDESRGGRKHTYICVP